ncbi:MAG: formimidoylglutamase [Gammaproteobacteria bacterium]|nr:formimidoylglutamase [Gammaproteobacteria bacterium]
MKNWQGRIDELEGAAGRRWHQVVTPFTPGHPAGAVVLVGFSCDAGVIRNSGRAGAAEGPEVLRRALHNMPVHECDVIADAGDVVCAGDELEAAQERFAAHISTVLDAGCFPIGLGGGHEIAWGSFLGLARHVERNAEPPRIGIINFDAHFDLRIAQHANSGTPFRQIAEECGGRGWPFHYCCLGVSRYSNTRALFERAKQLQVKWRLDEELGVDQLPAVRQTLGEFIARVDAVYLTLCLDALPAAVAPGVSAPAARGIGLDVIEPLVDAVLAGGKVRLADIAELNPRFDIDGRTAAVAARLVARIANGICRPA